MVSYLDYPFHIDTRGRAATTARADQIRDMIEQVLFTSPGERVNRPDFGCGLLQQLFQPNSDALAAATQFLVHGALHRWLADVIRVEQVRVTNDEGKLEVEVVYSRKDNGQRRTELFRRSGG